MGRHRIPVSDPYITEEDIGAVAEALRERRLSQGRYVREFEERFAKYVEAKYAVAVSSGTAALHTALVALGVGPGDEVITSSFTFISSSNCILFPHARPVLVDIEPITFNIDPGMIEASITEKTKAILPIDLFGHPCRIGEINRIARNHGLRVVEDACEALGAKYLGKRVGGLTDWTCFSFYPNKLITTGEGGMITGDDEELARKMMMIRDHGQDTRYHHIMLGYNYHMTDIQASLGISQLRKIDENLADLRMKANYYTEHLRRFENVTPPCELPGVEHSYMLYSVLFKTEALRNRVMDSLSRRGVEARIAFPPIHLQPSYRERFGFKEGILPVTEDVSRRILSIPLHRHLTQEDQDFIIDIIGGCL